LYVQLSGYINELTIVEMDEGSASILYVTAVPSTLAGRLKSRAESRRGYTSSQLLIRSGQITGAIPAESSTRHSIREIFQFKEVNNEDVLDVQDSKL
jgi:hypothetical protein